MLGDQYLARTPPVAGKLGEILIGRSGGGDRGHPPWAVRPQEVSDPFGICCRR